jgi:putative SOS response-associated peptidase YedK
MCGRFTLHTEKEVLARRFRVALDTVQGLEPRYNIAPSQRVLTIREADTRRLAESMRWGLVPSWAKDPSTLPSLINARKETVATKPSFRDAFRRRRCLIPADGFYEWQAPTGLSKGKTPYWVSLPTGEPFALAGLWSEWRPEDDKEAQEPLRTCTIITAPACPTLEHIHTRMPVILGKDSESAWLDPALDGNRDELEKLLSEVPEHPLRAHPVSRRVNSARNDGPMLITPVDEPSLGF